MDKLGSQTTADPLWRPLRIPEKQTVGIVCDSISQNAQYPASTFELSQCWRCKERRPLAEQRLLGDLRQSVPPNCGHRPHGPHPQSASPSPPQGSIWHRFSIDSTSIQHRFDIDLTLFRCRIDAESMPKRPLRRGARGGYEGGVRGACA